MIMVTHGWWLTAISVVHILTNDPSVSDLRSRPFEFLGNRVHVCGASLHVVNRNVILMDKNEFVEVGVLIDNGIRPEIVSQKICVQGSFARVDGKTKKDILREGERIFADSLFNPEYRITM